MERSIVGGVDATQDALAAMEAGDLDVTVFQNAAGQGQGAVDAALKLAKGEKVDSKVWSRSSWSRPANMDKYQYQELTGLTRAPGARSSAARRPARNRCEEDDGMVSPTTMAAVRESGAVPTAEYLLAVEGVRKEFPGVVALDNVQFRLRRGTVHALMGENGAGKSTLMKIIAGIYHPDAGDDPPARPADPARPRRSTRSRTASP